MNQPPFHLVFTSLWNTQQQNSSPLFLGNWCLNEQNIEKCKKLNIEFEVFRKGKVNLKKKYEDLLFCYKLVDEVMPNLQESLNQTLQKELSKRDWYVLLGPWLQNFVVLVFNRYSDLVDVFENHLIKSMELFNFSETSLAGSDTLGYYRSISSQEWNQAIYQFILKELDGHISTEKKPKVVVEHFPTIVKKSIKTTIIGILLSFLNQFNKRNKILIKDSYLPKLEEIRLSLKLGLVPTLLRSPEVGDFKYNESLREKLCERIRGYKNKASGNKFNDNFIRIFLSLIPYVIPKVFLEGFSHMEGRLKDLSWPLDPALVFTSNAYGYDEYFKFFVALNRKNGFKYVIGQHGANYGTYKSAHEWYEFKTADYFLSWGSGLENKHCQIVPAFNFKLKENLRKFDPKGNILLVLRGPGHRDGPQDRNLEHIVYQSFMREFYLGLDIQLKHKIVVRLHHGSNDFNTNDRRDWLNIIDIGQIDNGNQCIWKLISNSRLVIFGYDSSGFWECLALNIPTVCLWNGGIIHVEEKYSWLYEEMKRVGIYQVETTDFSNFLNKNWQDISSWWTSAEVQEVRLKFSEYFSRIEDNPSGKLMHIVADILKEN